MEEFPPDTEGQETAPLPTDEIMDIIYHLCPPHENKMIEEGFNYADFTVKEMTKIFEIKVENLEPKKEKRKSSAAKEIQA